MKLKKSFFQDKNSIDLARDLLGKLIVVKTQSGIISGIINEIEAYREDDEASHSFAGKKTKRNEIMFKDSGYIYVYFTYGMYHCINIVTESHGYGAAVLIRSIIPKHGVDLMIKNRNLENKNIKELSNGPAKVCMSLGINKNFNGLNIFEQNSNIYLEDIGYKVEKIQSSSRIGISKALDKKWRFYF